MHADIPFRNSEKGAALVVVLLSLILLTALGLAFAIQSSIEYQTSENYVTHQEVLAIADAGLNIAKATLQQSDFTVLLGQDTDVPAYVASDEPAADSQDSRNAISTRAARNVNFTAAPAPLKTYKANGILTPATGQPFANGRYFAKVTNNTFGGSSSVFGKDSDPTIDTDFQVLVRVTGVRPTFANEKVPETSTVRNSVATIEAMLKRNTAFDITSPMAVNGPSVSATFSGNKFYVDGYNHNGMTREQITAPHTENSEGAGPGLAAIYDNPSSGDATSTVQALYDMLNGQQSDNVVGSPGIQVDATPSVADITDVLRTSSNPDSKSVLDPAFVGKFVEALKPYANTYYGTSQKFSGTNVELGTTAAPTISYIDGNLEVEGSGSGAGILVVRGTLDVGGSFTYDGIVLVIGEGHINFHGANEGFIGGVYVQNLTKTDDGQYVPGQATLELKGNSDIYFSSDMIRMGLRLLPLQMTEWREITPEISK